MLRLHLAEQVMEWRKILGSSQLIDWALASNAETWRDLGRTESRLVFGPDFRSVFTTQWQNDTIALVSTYLVLLWWS